MSQTVIRSATFALASLGLGFAAAPPSADACEWHEMMASADYDTPQRYSPFARTDQSSPSDEGAATQSTPDGQVEAFVEPAAPNADATLARPRIPEPPARVRLAQGRESERSSPSQ
jgi:hypothetical protein